MTLSLDIKRRSSAELMAVAALSLLPGTQLAGSSVHSFGFSYDFLFKEQPDQYFLKLLEERMRFIAGENALVEVKTMMRENAVAYFYHKKQSLLAERIAAVDDNLVSLFCVDGFEDLCDEPYIKSTGDMLCFKIQEMFPVAFYEGKKIMRIDAIAFESKNEIKKYLKVFEEAKKKDHLKRAIHLKLVTTLETFGGKLALLPKGVHVRSVLQDWLSQEYETLGFSQVVTPRRIDSRLLQQLGVYKEVQARDGYISALYCPTAVSHASLAQSQQQLCSRYIEFCESYERNNSIKDLSLLNCENYVSDEANIFCPRHVAVKEITCFLHFILKIIKLLSIDYVLYLSPPTPPRGCPKSPWKESRDMLLEAVSSAAQECSSGKRDSRKRDSGARTPADKTEEAGRGDENQGKEPILPSRLEWQEDAHTETTSLANQVVKVGIGPRLQFRFKDALGREWDGAYIEVNSFLPERLGLVDTKHANASSSVADETSKKCSSTLLIRASVYSSTERIMALLIEKYMDDLPLFIEQLQTALNKRGKHIVENK